jgi:beta-glucosidase
MSEIFTFPKDFLWGTATSSYQIEGAVKEDGRGESIWDVFSHTPGRIKNDDTGDIATDSYHLYKQDIEIMKKLGVKAYRFSIAWPRVLPQGRGNVNELGVAYYDSLVDSLLKAGIQPVVTLFHWDLPSALPGAWLNRDTTDAFVEYTDLMTRTLGDRVKIWTTFNEIFCAAFLGYGYGSHAPGETNFAHALTAAHHMLLSHGKAVPVIRANVPDATVGIVMNPTPVYPLTDSQADCEAAKFIEGTHNRWLLDPVYGKGYPQDVAEVYIRNGIWSETPDCVKPGDMETIAAPIDMLGINIYSRALVKSEPSAADYPEKAAWTHFDNVERTDIDWEVYPQGLYDLMKWLNDTYAPKSLYITENGAAYHDGPSADGAVHDERRIFYLRRYLASVGRAVKDGIPLKGYFCWSLLDNYEWAHGYSQRFGIVYVDYATQKRTIKDSGWYYKEVIEKNGIEL